MIKNFILKWFIKPKLRKNLKHINPDEDGLAYLLDLLQEDEKRIFTSKFKEYYDFDLEYNREIQEQLKRQIRNYGHNN